MAKAQIQHVFVAVSIPLMSILLSGCGSSGDFLTTTTTPPRTRETVSIPLRAFKSNPFFYGVDVQVGANQTFTVMVDTGSPVFAVAASPAFGAAPYYQGACDGPSASFKYGGGTVWKGQACSGVDVLLGGSPFARAPTPLFAGIHETQPNSSSPSSKQIKYGDFQLVGAGFQGILGMSFQSQAEYTDSNTYFPYLQWLFVSWGLPPPSSNKGYGATNSHLFKPLFDSIADTMALPPIFSMQSCTTLGQFAGTMVLGGVNESLHEGDISYTPITFEGFYTVNVTRIGATVHAQGKNWTSWENVSYPSADVYTPPKDLWPNVSAAAYEYFKLQDSAFYVDSGNPYIGLGSTLLVRQTINWIAKQLGLGPVILEAVEMKKDGKVPACVKTQHLSHFPDVLIELDGGAVLRVPPSKYMQQQQDSECLWPFLIWSEFSPMRVLGNPVLETYYTVYDQANKRMGFAPVAGCQ